MVLSLATISSFYGSLPDSIIVQTSTINHYFDDFSAHAHNICVTDPEILIHCFINGLNVQIHREIFGKNYRSLLDVWLKARICEINLEEDAQLDLENQAQIQQNSVPEFQEQDSEAEFHTQIKQIQITNPVSQALSESEMDEEDSKIVTKMQEQRHPSPDSTVYSTLNSTDPEMIPQNSTITPLFTEKLDLHWEAEAQGATDLVRDFMVQRPPPEPPDLNSLVEELLAMQMPTGQHMREVADEENRVGNTAEDGAVVKGKVEEIRNAGAVLVLSTTALVVAPRSALSWWRRRRGYHPLQKGEAAVRNGDVDCRTPSPVAKPPLLTAAATQRRRSLPRSLPFVGKPPILLAAVLPWDRSEERHSGERQWRAATSAGGGEEAIETDNDEGRVALNDRVRLPATAEDEELWDGTAVIEKKSIKVLIGILDTNEVQSWRPWLLLMGQWQAPTHEYRRCINFLFEILGCPEIFQGDKQIYWVMNERLGYKQCDPGILALKSSRLKNLIISIILD